MGLLVSAEAGRGRQGCAARNKLTTKVDEEACDPFGLQRNEKKTLEMKKALAGWNPASKKTQVSVPWKLLFFGTHRPC
jgi:hypothetical protein